MGAARSQYYCGNNRNATNGKPIGTRSQCLRTGIGKGRHLPCTSSYSGAYNPIDNRRTWCGDGAMPAGYAIRGSPSLCLKKGIGLGKVQRAAGGCGARATRWKVVLITSWLILTGGVFLTLYLTKPSFIMQDRDESKIDEAKIILYTTIFGLIIGIICFLIWIKL